MVVVGDGGISHLKWQNGSLQVNGGILGVYVQRARVVGKMHTIQAIAE